MKTKIFKTILSFVIWSAFGPAIPDYLSGSCFMLKFLFKCRSTRLWGTDTTGTELGFCPRLIFSLLPWAEVEADNPLDLFAQLEEYLAEL